MKKFFISFLFVFALLSFSYSENVFSLSVAPDAGITYFSKGSAEYSSVDANIKFCFDYKHITNKNLVIGVGASIQPDSMTLGSTNGAINGVVLSSTGVGVNVAPIIGYRFGKKHLIDIELLPIIYQNTTLNETTTLSRSVDNDVIQVTAAQSGSKTTIFTEIRGNFQFGNSLVRNGFIVGLGFPWLIDLSTLKIAGLKTVLSDSYFARGFFVEIGYKLSFVI